jgi:hypothetical protein
MDNTHFPWYEVVQGNEIGQGEILIQCPVIQIAASPEYNILHHVSIEGKGILEDVVVITQACDIENGKAKDILLCPHYDVPSYTGMGEGKAKERALKEIKIGARPRYCLLNDADIDGVKQNIRIVDLGSVFSLPLEYLQIFSKQKGKRLRLLPPYRDYLSQSFARFFMRVGLPQNLHIP